MSRTLLDQAINIFSRGEYNHPQHARAIFQQRRLLLCQGDEVGARSLLDKIAALRSKYVPFDLRPVEELEDSDFEHKILFWLR